MARTSEAEATDPREALLDSAKEISADLVIVGTRGRRGIRVSRCFAEISSVAMACNMHLERA
jgi:nucleotide-binding universal stress UspA family protein